MGEPHDHWAGARNVRSTSAIGIMHLAVKVAMWIECVAGALIAAIGTYWFVVGVVGGHAGHHGAAYIVIFGALILLFGMSLLAAGLVLRAKSRARFIAQLIPGVLVAWVLWDIWTH